MTRRHRKSLAHAWPTIWLMTDERVSDAVLLAAAARLPKGQGGIVFRHYRTDAAPRHALFDRIAGIARRRRLTLLLASPAQQAAAWKADGWHGRDRHKPTRPLLHSMPAHNAREILAARRARADLIFLSPLYPTRSHPGAPALGRTRFAALARLSDAPVIALGGVTPAHRQSLRTIGAAGWAAIDGLTAKA